MYSLCIHYVFTMYSLQIRKKKIDGCSSLVLIILHDVPDVRWGKSPQVRLVESQKSQNSGLRAAPPFPGMRSFQSFLQGRRQPGDFGILGRFCWSPRKLGISLRCLQILLYMYYYCYDVCIRIYIYICFFSYAFYKVVFILYSRRNASNRQNTSKLRYILHWKMIHPQDMIRTSLEHPLQLEQISLAKSSSNGWMIDMKTSGWFISA